jgi:transposase
VVLDLNSGAVVFVGNGKGAEALHPFWKRLKRCRATIEAVAMDLSPAYIHAVQTHLSKAVIVFDHFHVLELFNGKLSDLRREVYREAKEKLHKEVLKGTRWLLLKNPENLDNTREEAKRLHEALLLNQPLATAYYLRKDLRRVWATIRSVGRPPGPRRLDSPSRRLRHPHPDPLRSHPGHPSQRNPQLLSLSHLDGTSGRHEHQDPRPATQGLRLSRQGVLQTQDLRPA